MMRRSSFTEALVMIVVYSLLGFFGLWACCLRFGLLPFAFCWPSARSADSVFAALEAQSPRFFAPGFKQVFAGGGIRHFLHKKRRDGNGISYEAMMYGELVAKNHRRMAWAKGYGADVMMLNRPAFLSYATHRQNQGGCLIAIRLDGPVSFVEMPGLIFASIWTAIRAAYFGKSSVGEQHCTLTKSHAAAY